MSVSRDERERRRRLTTPAVLASIRAPEPEPRPDLADVYRALDALERAGGDGTVWQDGTLYAGGRHIDLPAGAFFECVVRGWAEIGFGRHLRITPQGRGAVVRYRWGKVEGVAPPTVDDDEAFEGPRP
ncbi:hypothetical protein [Lichenifustis flavocetrariae]|uniref:Uncharacterized protein n=1 Tax=Lichenifustis flavocetrariae TaxID=2949735 RepID=A0AA41ZA61_9HYPH|nr:hypothetical protein [Lichenifustis flavocetrariae]MCW6512117.1 hypothetical protein [Lichenifustis flavocetrariae]